MAIGCAVGPWVSPDLDADFASRAEWHPGDVIEIQCRDDYNNDQGKGLLVVAGSGGKARLFEATMLSAENEYYSWWMFSKGGHPNPGLYRHAAGKGDDEEKLFKRAPVVPVRKWRLLNTNTREPDL
eukprot:5006988-Pyramimonas_sp.AAC.1